MNIHIVMPAANEEKTIAALLANVRRHAPTATIWVVMDKFSRDATADVVLELSRHDNSLWAIKFSESTGFASCYQFGFRQALAADADAVIEMDAGGSHDPAMIPRMVELLGRNDCVFSTRFARGGGFERHPLQRRLISWAGTKAANALLSTNLTDMTSGFEGFRSDVLRAIDRKIGFANFLSLRGAGHFFQTEMRFYCSRLRCAEMPITYRGSSSTLKLGTVWKSAKALYELGCRKPITWEDL
jgi:dolichol-phosphate mannosyltransferase